MLRADFWAVFWRSLVRREWQECVVGRIRKRQPRTRDGIIAGDSRRSQLQTAPKTGPRAPKDVQQRVAVHSIVTTVPPSTPSLPDICDRHSWSSIPSPLR